MNTKLFFLSIYCFLSLGVFGQETASEESKPKDSKILWLTLEEAQAKSELAPRKIMLFLYTDWCFWCKKMEETTFLDDEVANYINKFYYPVKFNAEGEEPVEFKKRNYEYEEVEPRGIHGLAMELMGGQITYPTITFLNPKWKKIQSIPNYKDKEKFMKIITYFGGNHYKRTPWSTFLRARAATKPRISPPIFRRH